MVKRLTLLWLAALLCLCGCASEQYDSPAAFAYYSYRSKDVFANGITFEAAVRGGNEQAALDEMYAFMEDTNAEMSITLSGSALARFNALGKGEEAEGYVSERVEVSRDTFELIELSQTYYADTAGAFNIAVYPLAELWNVHPAGLDAYALGNPEDSPPPPTAERVAETAAHCDPAHLHTVQEDGKYYLYKTDPALQIDLGAVAKGYAADRLVQIAAAHGVESALLNISGNICLIGDWYHPEQKKYVRWEVGVLSPRPRLGLGGEMCALSVAGGKTLVTSGDYIRYYETLSDGNALVVPHIVDGRTGLPLGITATENGYAQANDHIISATVIGSVSSMADAYATAVCLMPLIEATEFLRARHLGGILATQDGKMHLVNVTESDTSGETYFVYKDDPAYSGYRQYAVEEFR